MKRFRIYDGFKTLTTAKERYELAKKLISVERDKLERGITPFSEEERSVIYEDDLMYKSAARIFGKQKSTVITIRTYLNEFLQKKESEIIHHSYQTYKSKLRMFCMYMEMKGYDKIHISLITQEMMCDFVIYLVENNDLSRRSIVKYEQILYNFFDYLIQSKKILEKNPVHNLPRVGEKKDCAPHPINDRDRTILKKEMLKSDPQLWLVCQIEFYSAIRPGEEIRRMRIGDINFEAQTITIRKDISKNRQTETVGFPNQLLKEFVKVYHLDEYPRDYYVFGPGGIPGLTYLGKNNFRFRFDRIRDKLVPK